MQKSRVGEPLPLFWSVFNIHLWHLQLWSDVPQHQYTALQTNGCTSCWRKKSLPHFVLSVFLLKMKSRGRIWCFIFNLCNNYTESYSWGTFSSLISACFGLFQVLLTLGQPWLHQEVTPWPKLLTRFSQPSFTGLYRPSALRSWEHSEFAKQPALLNILSCLVRNVHWSGADGLEEHLQWCHRAEMIYTLAGEDKRALAVACEKQAGRLFLIPGLLWKQKWVSECVAISELHVVFLDLTASATLNEYQKDGAAWRTTLCLTTHEYFNNANEMKAKHLFCSGRYEA